jgi:two-component sensor histidine kinase
VPALTSSPIVVLTVPPVPEAASRVRRALVRGGLDPDLEHTVSLLTTEVVTNSIQHAGGGEIRVAATLGPSFVRVEVLDSGEGFDPDIRHERSSGFGLRLLDKLSSRWGVERARGTLVWFEVDRRRRRFGRD